MSLKDLLHSKIKELGYLSYWDICKIVAELGFKISNAERRLREMSDIEPVISKSKRGTNYISGYQYIQKFEVITTPKGTAPIPSLYKIYDPVTKISDYNSPD